MKSHDVEAESEDLTPVATPRGAGLGAALAAGAPGEDEGGAGGDADGAGGAGDPAAEGAGAPARGRRWTNTVVGVAALFSVAASAAVLIALWRGHGKGSGAPAETGEVAQAGGAADEHGAASAQPRGADAERSAVGSAAPTDSTDSTAQATSKDAPTGSTAAPPPRRTSPAHPTAGPSAHARSHHPSSAHTASRHEAHPAQAAEGGAASSSEDAPSKPAASEGAASTASDQGLPLEPSDAQVKAAFDAPALSRELSDCATKNGVTGTVQMRMKINPDGSVAWAAARLDNRDFQACLDHTFHKARMPASYNGRALRHDLHF